MMLHTAPIATPLTLRAIVGGQEIRRRLTELGLTTGIRFEIIQVAGSGPILLRISGSKIAIGRGMAAHIEVEAEQA